jgi:hypothetical protein
MEMKPYDDADYGSEADLEALVLDKPSEVYAVAGEFTDFVGQGGMEFMTMLTNLWDNLPEYKHPKIHGKSIVVEKPTVNIFGGNTVQGLALAIPPEALGNGFLSRVIFIHSEPTGTKIAFPPPVDQNKKEKIVTHLATIREVYKGELSYSPEAMLLLDKIYNHSVEVDDVRFKHYSTRRFIHLLKLCIVLSAMDLNKEVGATTVVAANTILANAERRMPKALGEFGKGKYSEVSSHILDILSKTTEPKTINQIFKSVGRDLTKITELSDIMKNLVYADKVQIITIAGKQGYMSKHTEGKEWDPSLIDESFLTEEELMQ